MPRDQNLITHRRTFNGIDRRGLRTVAVGDTAVRTNTIANHGRSSIVISSAQVNQTDFTIANQKLPLTLAPGQRAVLQLSYSPKIGGSSQGRVVLASSALRLPTTFGLKGTAIPTGRLSLTPAAIGFGKVVMGKAQIAIRGTVQHWKNSVVITRVSVSGKGFALSGLQTPLVLRPGQSVRVGVTFNPVAGGSITGAISVAGSVSVSAPRRPISFGERVATLPR